MAHRRFAIALTKILLPTILFISIIIVVDYDSTLDSKWQSLIKQQKSAVEAGRIAIQADLEQVLGDTSVLSSGFRVFDYIDFKAEESLKTQFLSFSKNKPRYVQIRFIDNKGMEVIRVERSKNGYALPIRKSKLQDKSSRYYFNQANSLAYNESYISPIDWNMENGKIAQPLTPTVRFAMPVFNSFSRRQGVVVINYLASHLISRFIEASGLHQQQLFLINDKGQLLYLQDKSSGAEWVLGKIKSLKEIYPSLWQQVENDLQGQMKVDNGYYTFTSVRSKTNVKNTGNNDWILISQLLPTELNVTRQEFFDHRFPLYSAIFVICFILSVIYTRIKVSHQETIKRTQYEQRFRQILEGLKLAAIIISPNGKLVFVNQYFLTQLGCKKKDILEKDWCLSFMEKENIHELAQVSALISNPKEQLSLEFRVSNNQVKGRTYKWTSSFFTDINESQEYLTLIGDDITDQLELEIERNKLFQVVEQAAITVMITNLKGIITYVNPNFTDITGYSSSEALGRSPSFLKTVKTDANTNTEVLWKTIENGSIWHGEFCNRKKNGQEYWEAATISSVKNKQNENIAYIAVKRDITEERRLSLVLKKEQENKLKHEHDAVVGRMAYMIAHDLRNPLSSIKMTMQMLPQQLADTKPEIIELTEISLEQIQYMENILTSLLAYARPDKNKHQWLELGNIIQTVLDSELKIEKYKTVNINYDTENDLPQLHADVTKMRQVFQNLIVNAIDAALIDKSNTPRVDISIGMVMMASGEKLRVIISNNGETIAPFMDKKIFEPFFTTKAKGTGLGLTIVKNIISYYNGEITLKAHQDGGTYCTVIIPIHSKRINKN